MKKVLKLNGLDCADCASKIEGKIKKIDGVEEANINFFTEKLILELKEDKINEILDNVKVLINKIEPDVKIMEI